MAGEQPDTDGDSVLREFDEPRTFDLERERYSIYECRECGNIVLTVNPAAEEMTCHGTEMREITEWEMEVQPPDLRQVLLDAFGLPKAGLDICLCVIGEGPLSPSEVADILDYDQSTVSRYLNELADIGLLEKAQLNREGGGFVNVYHSIDLDEMRRETLVGFYVWAGEAASLIEEANVAKEEYMEGDYSEGLQEVFWEEFNDEE
ncbi:MAG: helix-turn-helix domain-containing protein [Halobacteriaceae archaeon]